MLSSIKLDRNLISLSSYIPRGLEHLSDDENFLNTIQLFNYKLIELINTKYLIIMSNFCIKMLLATDLSSMSLRGKWFDFNTPNDVTPKRCRVLYEPEILINNPDLKKDAWEDLKEIKDNWVVKMKYFFIILLIGFCQNLSALSNKDVALYKSIFKDYRDVF